MLILLLVSLLCARLGLSAGDVEDSEAYFRFITRPDILAPRWDMKIIDQDRLQQGYYWFTSPYENVTQETFPHWIGPHIYDDKGELIWSGAALVRYTNSHDFRMSMINGQQMLSYIWCSEAGNNGYILDSSYEVFQVVDMVADRGGWNIHEFKMIEDGQRALIAFRADFTPETLQSSEFNGSCHIAHSGFEEIDRATGEVLFQWHTRNHIGLEETTYVSSQILNNTIEEKCAHPWDIAHINSLDKFDDGDYLISARHTNTLYKISHKDGSIVWRLGGIRSDFDFLNARTQFSRQHCALIMSQNETHVLLSLFDNATGGGNFEEITSSASSGMVIALDMSSMTADLISRYPKPTYDDVQKWTKSRGSMHFLPNGNAFMGWATRSHISEHSPDGQLLMTALWKSNHGGSYRIYKQPWTGRPVQPPDVVATAAQLSVDSTDLTTVVHVSWNGATEVDTWVLYRSNRFGNVTQEVASAPRHTFETRFVLHGYPQHIQLVAKDRDGQQIGQSDVISVKLSPDLHTPAIAAAEHQWVVDHSSDAQFKDDLVTAEDVDKEVTWFFFGFICSIIGCGVVLFGWQIRKRGADIAMWREKTFKYQAVNDAYADEESI